MSPEQIRLARHALGFGTGLMTSYRNRFCSSLRSDAHAIWCAMVVNGDAVIGQKDALMTTFKLTRQGAEKALRSGEKLDEEDFHER